MPTTNWTTVAALQEQCPHTHTALQHLVMAMAGVHKNRGKKSLFGKDKGLAAYKKFEEKLEDCVLAMVLDEIFARNAPASVVLENLLSALQAFAAAYPNWQDAYAYAHEFFVESEEVAEDRIANLMR